jgi:4-hydroxyphenylpyruvate dioxygenase
VAQTMAYDEMLTWVLFYRSIFATQKSPMIDVLDPAGLVRSQVIENASGTLRLTLNGAENRRTFAGQFVSNTFGSAIQHLAFATNDIFATARAMRTNGLDMLEISPNYYDDLAARHGLAASTVDNLKSLNILYDRDEAGEFFQFYGPTLGGGFFIEILERRGPYRGYGAPNAPFRIAAQKRALRTSTAN